MYTVVTVVHDTSEATSVGSQEVRDRAGVIDFRIQFKADYEGRSEQSD